MNKFNRKKTRLNFEKTNQFGFGFTSLKLKKPNRTEPKLKKKTSQTEKTKPNRVEPVFVQKNRTETGRFEPVSVFLVTFFLIKTEPNRKIIIPTLHTRIAF